MENIAMDYQKPSRQAITKSEFIEKLRQKQPHLPKKTVEDAVSSILEYFSSSLGEGKRIEIRRFGSFSLHHRKSRMVRNPRTGSRAFMSSKSIPHFKPGKVLRNRVNRNVSFLQEES